MMARRQCAAAGPERATRARAVVRRRRRAFTLIEMLIVIVLLGLAGALVIPSMGSVHTLRVQAALRTIVADLSFAQADAIAFQAPRAVIFDVANNRYRVVEVIGPTLSGADIETLYLADGPDQRYVTDFADQRYAGATITAVDFDGEEAVIFDDLGSPVSTPTGNTPGPGGTITLTGSGQTFVIVVEPFTGRITVRRTAGGE